MVAAKVVKGPVSQEIDELEFLETVLFKIPPLFSYLPALALAKEDSTKQLIENYLRSFGIPDTLILLVLLYGVALDSTKPRFSGLVGLLGFKVAALQERRGLFMNST